MFRLQVRPGPRVSLLESESGEPEPGPARLSRPLRVGLGSHGTVER